jgi:hypothetical protein
LEQEERVAAMVNVDNKVAVPYLVQLLLLVAVVVAAEMVSKALGATADLEAAVAGSMPP